jgi:hypothetical protein
MSTQIYDEQRMTTMEEVLSLMLGGDAWITRDGSGFYYLTERMGQIAKPINQELAVAVTKDLHVVRQTWKEGWGYNVKDTDKVRWVHAFSDLA